MSMTCTLTTLSFAWTSFDECSLDLRSFPILNLSALQLCNQFGIKESGFTIPYLSSYNLSKIQNNVCKKLKVLKVISCS